MDIFYFALIILIGLAVFDLIVGVSNDAVNFLNASIGSRVAPRHVIMVIASLGMLAGVTFSSGMMEVARKGIFHPEFFTMPELITIFLAVMLTDVLLLDTFNTFGLPTSTTVSIVFELLGAAVALSILKLYFAGDNLATLVRYINTEKAFAIVMGILLSVVLAFFFGVLVQFISRLIFTFNYTNRLKRYGGLWGGVALSVITYFILIKGAKGTSFLTPETVTWMKTHTWTILSMNFVFFAIIFQALTTFTKINILKPIVLIGSFALAMAFAANDLVNFIGVPLAGISAYDVASGMSDPLNATMGALQKKVQTDTLLLLIAGTIMVVTLWFSKKARTVSRSELSLANITDADTAVKTSFEQTGLFLKEISDTLGVCFECALSEDRHRLKEIKGETNKIQKWASVIVANIFKTLFLLHKDHISSTQKYSHTIRSLQAIAESHSDIVLRMHEHFGNYHRGFTDEQQKELRKIKTHITRLLWNTSIMLLSRKKVDYNYIASQSRKLNDFIDEFDKNQIKRIQNAESKTRLSILFYGIMENCIRIAEQTQNLLDIFKDSLETNP